jgi:Fe-Mn family superoxide dismutase
MSMPHELPPLPYAYDALEPHIDARTVEIHHDKHHAGYVTNLNKALEGHMDLAGKSVEQLLATVKGLPEGISQAVINHGGGHANHVLYWEIMGPGGGGEPQGDLAKAIGATFGDFEAFKEKLTKAALAQFGSGWAWLAVDGTAKLQVYSTPNHETPIMKGHKPILVVDVWEHAYYLNYQNRRADYIAAWWNLVNWEKVGDLYAATR